MKTQLGVMAGIKEEAGALTAQTTSCVVLIKPIDVMLEFERQAFGGRTVIVVSDLSAKTPNSISLVGDTAFALSIKGGIPGRMNIVKLAALLEMTRDKLNAAPATPGGVRLALKIFDWIDRCKSIAEIGNYPFGIAAWDECEVTEL